MPSDLDVIVIGAGAAGLAAAKDLRARGLTVQVIEGSHRIGGRAYSEELEPGHWFDLGCAWLVGGASNPFVPIADRLGLTLGKDKNHLFFTENLGFWRDGRALTAEERAACLGYYAESGRAIAETAEAGRDIALSEILDLAHDYAPPYCGSIGTSWGMDVDGVSSVDFVNDAGELGYPVLEGYGTLVAAWGADLAVDLNCRAERIDWSGAGVTVETPKGTIRGHTALITVSTGVLGLGEIAFSPDLPDWKQEAIHQLPMGTENKMGIAFERDVFGPEGRGHHTTWNADGTMAKVNASVMGLNSASVFVGGRYGLWLEKQGQEAGRAFALERIADIFGNDIKKAATRSIVTAWNGDPWTRGSWACANPGQTHQRAALARPVGERLIFAGEATVYGGQGTCDGAYRSGLRAAEEIAGLLGGLN